MKKTILFLNFILSFCFLHAQKWTQVGADIDGKIADALFGQALKLSNDGNFITVTNAFNNGCGDLTGPLSLFENVDGNWTLIDEIVAEIIEPEETDEEEDLETIIEQSGIGVKLSDDESTLAVSTILYDRKGDISGYVRVFKNENDNWLSLGKDLDIETNDDQSERTISLSSDGNIIAIGAPLHSGENGDFSGYVRVFKNENGDWTQLGTDINGLDTFDQFGIALTLSQDGTILAIGAPYHDENGDNSGQVQVYQFENENWVQIGENINGENTKDQSGTAISISQDNTTIAISANFNDENGNNAGHVRVYKNIENNWVKTGQDIDGENANDLSGTAISLSNDGTKIAVGAPFNHGSEINSGHIRVYQLTPSDAIAPIIIISSDEVSPTGALTIPILFTFSEDVIGFSADDILVTNATKGELTSTSKSSYVLNIEPNENGEITINVNDNVVTDVDDNPNTAALPFQINFDETLDADIINNDLFYITTQKPTLRVNSNESILELSITNIYGITNTKSTGSNTLNIDKLPTGVYFVKIKTTQKTITQKVIIE